MSRGTLPDERTPAVPTIALVGAPIAHQVTEVLGSDLQAPIWTDHSPIAHVARITCPMHAFVSTADVCMPVAQICSEEATVDLSEFPAGFRFSQRELDLPERTLSDAVPNAEFVRLSVPDGAELHDIMALMEGVTPDATSLRRAGGSRFG